LAPPLRLSEFVATLALAQDNAFGQPLESQLRSCLLATWLCDAAGLDDGALNVVGPDEASSGLGEVSVYADATTWAAAVSARPNACFYLKLVVGRDDPLYGVGTECTGREALDSRDPRW